jgi:hypothetical protein
MTPRNHHIGKTGGKMAGEVAPTRGRKTRASAVRVQKVRDEVYTSVDIGEAPEEIQTLADAMLEHITCCDPAIVDVRSFDGFGDDIYWQLNVQHEALIYRDGRPYPHGRVTTIRISDRG